MNTPAPAATVKPGAPAPAPAPAPANGSAVKPETASLSLNDITSAAFMLPAELGEAAAPVRARSEKQQAMDTKVKELHTAWIKAGKPSTWTKMVEGKTVATYFVEPDKSAELHKLINRSVALLGLRSRMGTSFLVTEKHAVKFNLPKHYIGREAISFAIMDKRPRATSDGKPAGQIVGDKSPAPSPAPAKK